MIKQNYKYMLKHMCVGAAAMLVLLHFNVAYFLHFQGVLTLDLNNMTKRDFASTHSWISLVSVL